MATPMRRGRTRLLFAGVSAVLMLLLATQSTLAAVSWTSAVKSSPSYAYNYGAGLAKTTSTVSGTTYLHSQYTYLNTPTRACTTAAGSAGRIDLGHVQAPEPVGRVRRERRDRGRPTSTSTSPTRQITAGSTTSRRDPRPLQIRINTNHGSSTPG